MFNILDAVTGGFSAIGGPVGLAGSLVTIFDHFRNANEGHMEQTLRDIRGKSKTAYKRYCEYRMYRQDALGVPVEEKVLGYWEECLRRSVLPSAEDLAACGIASAEEAEVLAPCLMEQWMTVPEFSAWLHDILAQNHLEELAERLSDLPQALEAVFQVKEQLETQGLHTMATVITPASINEARRSCDSVDVRNFFTIDTRFHTMLRVISAEEDVPHQEAAEAVMELIQRKTPVIIAGNGGQGKSSLMMRIAVQWAAEGRLAVWMPLSEKETFTEQAAEQFFQTLLRAVPGEQRVLLCIDNPFEGRESLSRLQARWPRSEKIQLLMAERENRLAILTDRSRDRLLHWYDGAGVVALQGAGKAKPYRLKDYQMIPFSERPDRRKLILEKCVSYLVKDGTVQEADRISVTQEMLSRYGGPEVSLVELIYRTLFALKKVAAKPENIKMDWEEWGELIRREFGNVDSDVQLYGVIAAFGVFHTPLPLPLFCKYFGLKEHVLRNRLRERFVPRHIEPVAYQEERESLRPKHDVIADLFFLFNRDKVTIDSLMLDLIRVMDENEIEAFLESNVRKRELQKGRRRLTGRIDYWAYMEGIYSRIQRGGCNLSRDGRARLCLGVLWARRWRRRNSPSIQTVLETVAPEFEDDLLMKKLYTEWGIWAKSERNDALAEEKFLTVMRADSRDVKSRMELGRLRARQKGREEEAKQLFLDIIRMDNHNIPSRTELGRLLVREGEKEEAEKYFREIIGFAPRDIQSHTELGKLLAGQRGREEEAERVLRKAMEIDRRHIQSRTELGRLYVRQGRKKKAEEILREAIEIDPKNLHPHTELGRLLAKQPGREEEAEFLLRETIRLDHRDVHAHTVLAQLYERMNKTADAIQLYREICEIAPDDRIGKDGLARLESRQRRENLSE